MSRVWIDDSDREYYLCVSNDIERRLVNIWVWVLVMMMIFSIVIVGAVLSYFIVTVTWGELADMIVGRT